MLTAFDVGVGILVLISAILATARGLTREVLSLLTWAGSAVIAIWMWQYHLDLVYPGLIAEEPVAIVALVLVTFIVALIVLHLITMRIADLVVDSKIGPLDRTLGFIFGGLRGILIAVVLTIFGQWLLGDNLPEWASESRSMPMLNSVGDGLIAALPSDMEEQVNNILQRGVGEALDGAEDLPPDEGTDSEETELTPA